MVDVLNSILLNVIYLNLLSLYSYLVIILFDSNSLGVMKVRVSYSSLTSSSSMISCH